VLGIGVTATNIAVRSVTLSDDKALPFAKLVFATNSRPICLHIAGTDLPRVFKFPRHERRRVNVAGRLPECAHCRGRRRTLGIEAAYGLAKAGASVILIHLMDSLTERQLDPRTALLLKRSNQLTRNHPQRGPRMRGARSTPQMCRV
jgi:nitrite reductase (NADH) large subunit